MSTAWHLRSGSRSAAWVTQPLLAPQSRSRTLRFEDFGCQGVEPGDVGQRLDTGDQGDEAALQVALGIANHLLRALQVELPYPCRIIKEADERKELVEQLPVDRLVPVQCA